MTLSNTERRWDTVTEQEPLTQPKYEEEWRVVVNKDIFTLNGNQIEILKRATKENARGIVWFEKFAISIPHIQSIYRISKRIKNRLPEAKTDKKFDEEEHKKIRKKVEELKKDLSKKWSSN